MGKNAVRIYQKTCVDTLRRVTLLDLKAYAVADSYNYDSLQLTQSYFQLIGSMGCDLFSVERSML